MLSASDLSTMRAAQQLTMLTACYVRRKSSTTDSQGGHTTTNSDTATVCRIAPTGGDEAEIAAKLEAVTAYTITLPYGTDVLASDEIVIGSTVYAIRAVLDGGDMATAVRVIAVRSA